MLEGLVAWVLNTYLGEYVENLNTDQLSVGIVQGQVELDNLPLKKDALKFLDLPVEVKSGFIGRVSLSIPWRKLNSEPSVITLEKLYLVAGPLINSKYNAAEEEKNDQSSKQTQLKALEEKFKMQRKVAPQQGSSWWSYWSYGASIGYNVVENLQLEVKDVHLRYEDDTTIPGHSFATGVVIKSLSASSTDGNWLKSFVDRSHTDLMHKLADLKDFSVYWDVDAKMVGKLGDSDLEDELSRPMYTKKSTDKFSDHNYILQPVCVQAKMKRNTCALPLRSPDTPRLLLDIELDRIPLELGESQYYEMIGWMREYDRFDRGRKYRKWKPTVKIKNNAKEWWTFAITALLYYIKERNKRSSKAFILQRARDNVKYVEAYTQCLTKGAYYMDRKLKEAMERIEKEWTFQELKVLRDIVMKKVSEEETLAEELRMRTERELKQKQEAAVSAQQKTAADSNKGGYLQSWFPGWGGWSSSASATTNVTPTGSKDLAGTGGATLESGIDVCSNVDPLTLGVAETLALPTPPLNKQSQSQALGALNNEIVQEIVDSLTDTMENNTLLKRDTVFAQVNFCLKSGTFRLLGKNGEGEANIETPLLELECDGIKMDFVSRPRTNGMKFGVSVGGLFLRDKMTHNSIMPALVAPQHRFHSSQSHPKMHVSGLLGMSSAKSAPSNLFNYKNKGDQVLFEMVYEKRPPQSNADYRFEITTQPLDIVYNPNCIKRVKEFFSSKHKDSFVCDTSASSTSSKYGAIMKQTQVELKHTVRRFLEGDEAIKAKRWDVKLDVSAPQIIMPESMTDENTALVLFDLGHLQFYNTAAGIQEERRTSKDDEDEDDFVTPSSTPPSEEEKEEEEEAQDIFKELSQTALHDKIYDKYTINLTDVQVMVGKAKDNWGKHAHGMKGTSHMHVLDKFNISLQFERRLLYTSDPQWPKTSISGTLPALVLHVNEQKIQSLQTCLDTLLARPDEYTEVQQQPPPTPVPENKDAIDKSMYYSMYQAYSKSIASLPDTVEQEEQAKQALAESKLILAQFCINHVSVQVESLGRSIAELQVAGVKANFTQRPFDTSISFTVHSLLIVDALQTFGSDFELLMASHKSLCLDSRSGSMRDSDPNSPVSPRSPLSPASPAEPNKPVSALKSSFSAIQHKVSNALQGLVANDDYRWVESHSTVSPNSSFRSNSPPDRPNFLPLLPNLDTEALIKIELDTISPQCPTNTNGSETLHIANVQFNNLDFVANQQTIVELLSFVKRLGNKSSKKSDKRLGGEKKSTTSVHTSEVKDSGKVWEVIADFHRLNVLLMRVEEKNETFTARKVATVQLSDAKIMATLGPDTQVEGSLGGVQLLDLTPETNRYQKVFSVGLDPGTSHHLNFLTHMKPDMFQTANESMFIDSSSNKAFTFNYLKSGSKSKPGSPYGFEDSNLDGLSSNEVSVNVRMASLCYTHSPRFLKDLSGCLVEFKEYIEGVGSQLKTAAAEVAMGIVHKRGDLLSTSVYAGSFTQDDDQNDEDDIYDKTSSSSPVLKIDAMLQSPVIVLPRTPNSPEVLVGHLGKITLRNSSPDHMSSTMYGTDTGKCEIGNVEKNKIYMEIRDINVSSVNLDRMKIEVPLPTHGGLFDTPKPANFTKPSCYSTPILHDTVIELSIQKLDPCDNFVNIDSPLQEDFLKPKKCKTVESSVLEVNGKVVTPLKLALSKQVYEQILKTLDNIAPPDDDDGPTQEEMDDTAVPETSDSTVEPSLSSLKLDPNDLTSSMQSGIKDKTIPDSLDSSQKTDMILRAKFEMPYFNIRMTGDLGDMSGEQGIVDIHLEDFKVLLEKGDPYTKSMEVSLRSLKIEDLLQNEKSEHRFLMVSSAQSESAPKVSEYLSSSCPTSMIDLPETRMPSSLPSSLHHENVFEAQQSRKQPSRSMSVTGTKTKQRDCPCTPPPSPQQGSRRGSVSTTADDDLLVYIKILLVDKKCPQFASKYDRTNRFVDVDFNTLATTINLQTWVVVLDFLGMGAKVHNPADYTEEAQMTKSTSKPEIIVLPNGEVKEEVNTEVDLKVQSFSLIFNKQEYELTKATISNFNSHVSLKDGNFAIKGQLGSLALQDSSPHGRLYRERFITTGSQALDFDIFKYGTPDPDLLRPHDISVKLRMSSVRYVHTHHFMQEMLAFCQHFNQLQDVLGRMRAANQGITLTEKAFRGARIHFDVEAGSPIMLIPHSSQTTDILVLNMGHLTVYNKFVFAGSPGTILHQRELHAERKRNRQSMLDLNSSGKFDSDKGGITSPPVTSSGLNLFSQESAMTSSIYGSLDDDWREDAAQSPLESTMHSVFSEPSLTMFTSALGSSAYHSTASLKGLYGSLGTGGANSTTIGPPKYQSSVIDPDTSSASRSTSTTSLPKFGTPIIPETHVCLLDCLHVELSDMDIFSAEWKDKASYEVHKTDEDLEFPSYFAQREKGKLLKERCKLTLQVERNLEGDLSHSVPDFCVNGRLSSVHFSLDIKQYKLVKGLLAHNFGEPLPEFQRSMMSHLQDPQIQTVLSGEVWKGISITLELENVSTELLVNHKSDNTPQNSLARFDFLKSRLSFESYSDGCKDIDLVSHEIRVYDTRYEDSPVNTRPSVFNKILQPSKDRVRPEALQMELHWRTTKDFTRFTILLNNMRLMGVFDWLLACKDFLLTGAEDPWKQESTPEDDNADVQRSQSVPLAMSTGVMTKGVPANETKEAPFELKLNITDTELVVVEDPSAWDTNAVILKSTAVLSFKPSFQERPLSCSLQSLEVFSCSLAAEDETALSIIDPMIVTLELNGSSLSQPRTSRSAGLLDATSNETNIPPVLEVTFSTDLNIRLSYHDMKLFKGILKSMPNQLIQASSQPKNMAQKFSDYDLQKLQELGFNKSDCEFAMETSKGRLDDAALWLTQNAKPVPVKKEGFQISGYEVKASSICVCLIDDCRDADVPLAELTFSNLHFLHKVHIQREGRASFRLSGDYYNRSFSGWEPFLESWGCQLGWHQDIPGEENTLKVDVRAKEVLNLNVTRVLIEQYNNTKDKWTEDYYKQQDADVSSSGSKRRTPFIPFAVRNQTGCTLWFSTVTTAPTRKDSFSDIEKKADTEWKKARPGEDISFIIEEREKIRHKHTHELKVQQLAVRVEGWKEVSPVSVDKVGVYFREAETEPKASPVYNDMPAARIVFDVKLEGSARKVITIRSALTLHNQLKDELEVKLESLLPFVGLENQHIIVVPSGERLSIPLKHVHSRLWVRPKKWSLKWCDRPITWTQVDKNERVYDGLRGCDTPGGYKNSYRFCVSVEKLPFPQTFKPKKTTPTSPHATPVTNHPGHVITITPPVRIINLLPIDMEFYMKNTETEIRATIKPGCEAALEKADLTSEIELGVRLENFPKCKDLMIPAGTQDYRVKLRVFDNLQRQLDLLVKIKACLGGSLKLFISAPYWLVNKSGLPLIFKQEGTGNLAAGQFEEHEFARSMTPLLFSYADKEHPNMCTMKLGKSVHGVGSAPDCYDSVWRKALWCPKFSLERDVGVRQLHVASMQESRPDWVYNIGIEVRQGRGRYLNTKIVTFTPRYQIDNRSSFKLAFAQKHMAIRGEDLITSDILSAVPNCKLSFHWPRVDLDLMLCVRIMGDKYCDWSGGFRVDKVDSFHVNMRGENNVCTFLRVDVVLQGATFFVVLTDADHMPPPYRIDNFSEVPIVYFQTKVADDRLRTNIKPKTSVPYAWDEPTLPPHLTLSVAGGTSATYNLDIIKDGDSLCYENFIYISFTGTFKNSPVHTPSHGFMGSYTNFMESQELVLEAVPGSNRVLLKKKEVGNRQQLWRMTSTGMLHHEGSSVPRDPRKSSPSASSKSNYVLDIADIALQPGRDVPLILRKVDPRRKSTQTWTFTEDGRLLCGNRTNMCVQAKDGSLGVRPGTEAILGPSLPSKYTKATLPIEMAISRQKMRPGSGMLSVKVLTDGPTRVLEISDIRQASRYRSSVSEEDWVTLEEVNTPSPLEGNEKQLTMQENKKQNLDLKISLPHGIGISLVNKIPEELMYISLKDIDIDYCVSDRGEVIEADVKNIQVDNQLFGNNRPVFLFVTPTRKDSSPEEQQTSAIKISALKLPNYKWNADIFRYLIISMKKMTLQLEENLLWKLFQFLGYGLDDVDQEALDENSFDSQRALTAATSASFKRYYFGTLKLNTSHITLSVYTASELQDDLSNVKKTQGFPLMRFEEAKVEIDPFTEVHVFETRALLLESIKLHYTTELKSQAAKILGSVDFLGNPLGLFHDFTEGLSGLLKEGDVGGLVKNVTHGISDSTAKVTGSLSHGMGIVTFDDDHQRTRERIRDQAGSSSQHLVAGIKGFGHGMFGGLTSIVSQTYSGVKDEGITGLFTGLGKGVVGTVTKPVAGVLDLASGAASAVRDTSKGHSRQQPPRQRLPRCCYGPGGLLPAYSEHHADAQKFLFSLNGDNCKEMFVAIEQLRNTKDDNLKILISSEGVYFLGGEVKGSESIILNIPFQKLYNCRSIPLENKYYLELTAKVDTDKGMISEEDPKKRPLVRCDEEPIAMKVSQQINYAKNLFNECKQTLPVIKPPVEF